MRKHFFTIIILFCLFSGVFYSQFVLAQTVNLTPQTLEIDKNTSFSLTSNIESVSDLFGLSFDLDFDPTMISFVSVNEGDFLSQGCQTSFVVVEDPPGKLIVGLTRLGVSCGGVSGIGELMTFTFRSLNQSGTGLISFSNNSLCLLEDSTPSYVTGDWLPANVTIPECDEDRDCEDDGKFCNGDEICVGRICVHAGNPCPTGYECNEETDSCEDNTPPAPPSGLIISYGPMPLGLAWDSNIEADLAYYRVYYGTTPRNYINYINVDKQYPSCEVVGLTVGQTYYITLTAIDFSLNESSYSAELCVLIEISLSTTTTITTTTPSTISTTTTSIPECGADDDCEDDGLFCNGDEICSGRKCVSAGNPCEDDDLFCNGEENCNENRDICTQSGDPCPDDGLFCTGVENCDEEGNACLSSGDPCNEGEECVEETNACLPAITPPCKIIIEPESIEVGSGQTLIFIAKPEDEANCDDHDYEWSVQSIIGSNCDHDTGNYTAGINFNVFNPTIDVMKVVDHGNKDTEGNDIEATATITVYACALLQIYGEDSEEVKVLRYFRDNVLTQTPEGQEIIRLYYQWSPLIVKAMEEDEEFKEDVKEMIDGVLTMIDEAAK